MEHIGRYQIISEIGKGAMAVVYKASDPNIGRTVAIKTLRLDTEGMEAEEMLQRFKNEARAAGVMNHPNLITIYDAGEQEGMFYIVMEFIEGQTLQAVLKQEQALAPQRAMEIASQVCAGLDYAHAHGIIHRDIKPANIMITDSTVKIMDFGIAKGGGSGMTSTGQVVGTPNYMSPEQVKGKPLDGRSDLFSLGVVLYEMLTGERPFVGQNVTTIIYKIVNETPPAPNDLDASVPPGLSTVVMKALAKAPEERYGTGAEFAHALQNYKSLPSETVGTMAPAPIMRPVAWSNGMAEGSAAAGPAAKTVSRKVASLDSTVSALPMPARTPTRARRITPQTIGIATGVVAVMLAMGALWHARRVAQTTMPVAELAAPAPPPSAAARAREAKHARATATANTQPATPSASGDLQISSTPFGAAVTIDGKSTPDWVTPFAARKLKPGRHTVNYALKGYERETREVEVVAGQKLPLHVQLQVAQGTLALGSDPAGAAIYLDGVDTGQVTPARITVNEGQHRIALRKDGFKPQVTYAEVSSGKVFNLAPALKAGGAQQAQTSTDSPTPSQGGNPFRRLKRLFGKPANDDGVLEIRTRPKGAEIWVGDRQAGSKTPTKLAVVPGTYKVTLRLPGYKPITRSVQVEKGKVMGVDEIFEAQ